MHNLIQLISDLFFLSFVIGIPLYGTIKKVPVFDTFVDGAKEGITIMVKLLPYLIGMLVAIGMLRASGFFNSVSHLLAPLTDKLGIPNEVLPLAIIRPFSGSASIGIMTELIHNYGGNSYIAKVAATMLGSTETTFYVIAVYFGAVGIRRTRYAIHAGLIADITGMIAAIIVCKIMFT